MTGSPIAKNLVDEWSQLKLLDEGIVGHRYLTTFRNEYCIMGGFEGKQVVGSKNLARFKDITAPYVFRVKKEDCLDLPEKQYRKVEFKLSPEQIVAINQLKTTQIYTTAFGDDVFFEGAAPTLGKIQEVSNGFIAHEFGLDSFPNPRMEMLKSILEDINGKVVIWARYKHDIRGIHACLGDESVTYFGDDDDKARAIAKQRFCDPDDPVKYFVATPATAAEGLDGLQRVSSTAIYYSNGFNSVQRWQSEDRIHRIGMGGSAVYIDLVAKGCIDYSLLRNLKAKKDFSTLVLDVGKEMGLK
jgi:SNF2 family DNA or RNA helicase